MAKQSDEIVAQRRYYADTAHIYDTMHVSDADEHGFALQIMLSMLDFMDIKSVLDIGSGTGRCISEVKRRRPHVRIRGIEPVAELRSIGHGKGIGRDELTDGDALALDFQSGEFDLVCEFGVLHHLRRPERAVAEMLRVARKAIFISDSNNFGQGRWLSRSIKQCLHWAGLWPFANYVKTRGKGYSLSAGDGVAYSYSVFTNYRLIQAHCNRIHIFNTTAAGINPYRTAKHVALLGIKST